MLSDPVWVGLNNYREILLNTESTFHKQFVDGIKNTLFFVFLDAPVSIAVPLTFAVLLNARPRGHKLFQAILYVPTLFSITAVGIIWRQILNKNYGIPSWFDVKTVLTATSPYMWIFLIMFSVWWTMGGNLVIYTAALGGVDKTLYESAALDGAGEWKKFWNITLPSIRFPLSYTLITTIAGGLNVYGQPLMITSTGNSTGNAKVKVMVMYIRDLAFGSGQALAGLASAMAMILGLLVMIVSVVQFRMLSKED